MTQADPPGGHIALAPIAAIADEPGHLPAIQHNHPKQRRQPEADEYKSQIMACRVLIVDQGWSEPCCAELQGRRARQLAQKGALYPWRTINGEEASAYYAAGTAQYHIDADISYALSQLR